jgi:hypothetical protein
MNELISLEEWVLEYQVKQKEVMKWFVYWCVELGEILLKYRDKLKPQWLWLKYLEEIKLNNTMAGNQIRLFELSQWKIEKEVLGSFITNWEKLNLFLALPDDKKEEIVNKQLTTDTSNSEFREAIAEVKWEVVTEYDTKYEDEMRGKLEEVASTMDTKIASKMLQDNLQLSAESRELLEWILHIEKTKEILNKANKQMNAEEKEKIKQLYARQLSELNTSLDLFF